MTITNTLNEQLFQELDNQVAQNYNGGSEVFTIANQTKYNIPYFIGGKLWRHKPKKVWRYTTFRGGIIKFDLDARKGVINFKKYNLANKGKYAFRANKSTSSPYDIELYDIG